jgi:DNA gyrase subunit A
MVRLSALDLPTLPPTNGAPSLGGGAPLAAYVDLGKEEEPVTIVPIGDGAPVLALGTAGGIVKRVTADAPRGNEWDVIALRDGDRVVGAAVADREDLDLVFITTDAQLLRFGAKSVRPQGRSAGGMAGIKLAGGARALFFGVVDPAREGVVVTSAGSSGALPGTEGGSLKVTPYAEYPAKGRATGGVRCHRFLKGEDLLVLAFAGNSPARAAAANGVAIDLPPPEGRRDGSGVATGTVIATVVSPPAS